MSRSLGTEMRGISLRVFGAGSGSGFFFLSSIFSVYTHRMAKRELFEGFQRRLLGKFRVATKASHKVDRFSDRHRNAKIQCDPAVLAGLASDLFEAIGDIWLGASVKLHICVDGKAVSTFHADAPPLTIRLHEAAVDPKPVPLAYGAVDRRQSLFNFFRRERRHSVPRFVMNG